MHFTYLEPASEAWLVAPGGRCYKKADVAKHWREALQCPECERWFKGQWNYEQHYGTKHRK